MGFVRRYTTITNAAHAQNPWAADKPYDSYGCGDCRTAGAECGAKFLAANQTRRTRVIGMTTVTQFTKTSFSGGAIVDRPVLKPATSKGKFEIAPQKRSEHSGRPAPKKSAPDDLPPRQLNWANVIWLIAFLAFNTMGIWLPLLKARQALGR